ncbi:MAG: hypothetical protein ACTSPI_13325 [Candidatus Heimdallarchaeaceae archaeon]
MAGAWSVAQGNWKDLFDLNLNPIELPWTISYVIRKRQQVDSFNELPKEKRPTEFMIWWGAPEEIDVWFDKVFNRKNNPELDTITLVINEDEIE